MAEKFGIYRPLNTDKQEFRLMQVEYHDDEGIQCSLQVFEHNLAPSYEALSYAWTEEGPSREIQLNAHRFFVRPNLHEFLKRAKVEHYTGWIFIDALCINQNDKQEKGSQIRMMSALFRRASGLVAWLGSSYPKGDVDPKHEKIVEHEDYGRLRVRLKWADEKYIFCWFPWSYWSRLWIVQEIIICQRVTFRLQEFKLEIAEALEMLSLYCNIDKVTQKPLAGSTCYGNDDATEAMLLAHFFLRWRNLYHRAQNSSLALFDAVVMLSQQRCREKYDIIFGLLGLTRSLLQPDYDMPRIELYLRVLIEGTLDGVLREKRPADMRYFNPEFIPSLLSALGLSGSDLLVACTTYQAWKLCKAHCGRVTELEKYFENPWVHRCGITLSRKWLTSSKVTGPGELGKGKTLTEWARLVKTIYQDVLGQMQLTYGTF